jgi:hypothetical protein
LHTDMFRCLVRGLFALISLIHTGRGLMPRLLTITFTTAAFRAEAAYGSLKPPPARRLRRALLHLSYSMTFSRLLDTTTSQAVAHYSAFPPFVLVAHDRRQTGNNGANSVYWEGSHLSVGACQWKSEKKKQTQDPGSNNEPGAPCRSERKGER